MVYVLILVTCPLKQVLHKNRKSVNVGICESGHICDRTVGLMQPCEQRRWNLWKCSEAGLERGGKFGRKRWDGVGQRGKIYTTDDIYALPEGQRAELVDKNFIIKYIKRNFGN